jgi:hypothetical protein
MHFRRLAGKISGALLPAFAAFSLVLAFGVAPQERTALSTSHAKIRQIMEIQEAATPDLMANPDVIGTAVGADDDGNPSIVVYVNLEGRNPSETVRSIPKTLRGANVTVEVTEPFRAMVGKPGGSSHTAKQQLPIQLGTSGGFGYDLANGYCCGGTLGSLVKIGNDQYILSNYHVFESDIVSGGNNLVAKNDDPVIQPGLIDVSCNLNNAQTVATLAVKSSLPSSNVDASVAKVVPGAVSANGSILEIGTISVQTIAAFIGQAVKKSGRTTGLTRSSISGLNATVSVAYDNECAGGAAFTKTFQNQIIISNKGSRFLNSGDSGSLMVEDADPNPRAVGLLFAGSSSLAVANPINEVLSFLNATMVGQ